MSDNDEEDQGTYSGCVIKKEQEVYIKIECLRDYITNNYC